MTRLEQGGDPREPETSFLALVIELVVALVGYVLSYVFIIAPPLAVLIVKAVFVEKYLSDGVNLFVSVVLTVFVVAWVVGVVFVPSPKPGGKSGKLRRFAQVFRNLRGGK